MPEDLLNPAIIEGFSAFQICEKKRGLYQKDILSIRLKSIIVESKKSTVSGKELSTNTSYSNEIKVNSSGFIRSIKIKFRELEYSGDVFLCAYKLKKDL